MAMYIPLFQRAEWTPTPDPTVPTLTLTPDGTANRYPCAACASTSQLLAAIAIVSYSLNHAGNYDVNDMIDDAKCFRCLTDHQMLQAILNSLVAIALANGYFENAAAAIQAANCLECTDPKTIKAIMVKALAEYVNGAWPS